MKRAAILLFLLVSIAYGNSLSCGFLWDDFETITENPSIRSWKGMALIFNPEQYFKLSGEIGWRPLTSISFVIDYAVWKLNAGGYHLTNIILHYLCCLLLYAFLRDLTTEKVSLCAAALFAVHPIQTEVVDAVSFRDDILCLVFMLAALKLSMRRRGGFAIPSAALYFLALISKETAYPLPLIIIACDMLVGRRFRSPRRAVLRYIPYLIVAVLFSYLRFGPFLNPGEAEYGFYGGGLENRILIMPELLLRYLLLLILPVNLSADHVFPIPLSLFSAPHNFRIFLAAEIVCVAALAVTVIAAALSRARKDVLFAFVFFVLTFGMLTNIVPLPNILAERYLYIPSVSFCLFTAVMLERVRLRRLAILLIMTAYILLTVRRNLAWRNEEALWSSTARSSPGSFRAHNHLGLISSGKGRLDEAIKYYEKSLAINPRNGPTYNNLGLAYLRLGMCEKAERAFRGALKTGGESASTYNNLGNLFMEKGESSEARRCYERAVEIDPVLSQARFNLASLHEAAGEYPEAIRHVDAVIGNYPGMGGAWLRKGRLMDRMGKRSEAIPCYERARSFSPGIPSVYILLGNAYFLDGRYDDAIVQLVKAARFEETRAGARLNLGNCYMKKGDVQRAIGEYRRAIEVDCSLWEARGNLGIAYEISGMPDEAIAELEQSLEINPDQEDIRKRLENLREDRRRY